MRHYDCNSLHFHFAGYQLQFRYHILLTYTPPRCPSAPPHLKRKAKVVSKFTHKHASPSTRASIKSLSHSFHSFQSFQYSNSNPFPTQKKKKEKKDLKFPFRLHRARKQDTAYGKKKTKKEGGGLVSSKGGSKRQTK